MIPAIVPFFLMMGAYLAQYTIDATWSKPTAEVDEETGEDILMSEHLWSARTIKLVRGLATLLFISGCVTVFFIK